AWAAPLRGYAVGPSAMKTAPPLQTNCPRSIRSGQTSSGPRFARVITPSAPTGVPRSWNSPPVATTGASASTTHASAGMRDAAPPPSTRIDVTPYLPCAARGRTHSYCPRDDTCKTSAPGCTGDRAIEAPLLYVGSDRRVALDGEAAGLHLVALARASTRPADVAAVGGAERDRRSGVERRRAGAADRDADPGGAGAHALATSSSGRHREGRRLSRRRGRIHRQRGRLADAS